MILFFHVCWPETTEIEKAICRGKSGKTECGWSMLSFYQPTCCHLVASFDVNPLLMQRQVSCLANVNQNPLPMFFFSCCTSASFQQDSLSRIIIYSLD